MKKTAAVASVLTTALALGGASASALAATPVDVETPGIETAEANAGETFSPFVRVSNVQGVFGASQDVVSPLGDIANRFSKAATALCASLPDYDVTAAQGKIAVTGDVENPFEATVTEMTEEEEAQTYLLKCACASNIPGGGAIINAKVEGVSLASIAALARA